MRTVKKLKDKESLVNLVKTVVFPQTKWDLKRINFTTLLMAMRFYRELDWQIINLVTAYESDKISMKDIWMERERLIQETQYKNPSIPKFEIEKIFDCKIRRYEDFFMKRGLHISLLAFLLGKGESTIRKRVKKLEDLGILESSMKITSPLERLGQEKRIVRISSELKSLLEDLEVRKEIENVELSKIDIGIKLRIESKLEKLWKKYSQESAND